MPPLHQHPYLSPNQLHHGYHMCCQHSQTHHLLFPLEKYFAQIFTAIRVFSCKRKFNFKEIHILRNKVFIGFRLYNFHPFCPYEYPTNVQQQMFSNNFFLQSYPFFLFGCAHNTTIQTLKSSQEGDFPYKISYGVFPFKTEEGVRFIKSHAVNTHSPQTSIGRCF